MASRIVLNNAELNKLLKSRSGGVARAIFTKGKRVEAEAKRLCPVNTGRLRSSIQTEMEIGSEGPVAKIGTRVKYAPFVHEGTGIFGPRGNMIKPKRARFLVFRPKGSNTTVFAKQVKGFKGVPFLKEALKAARK